MATRCFERYLLLSLMAFCLAQAASAQEVTSMSSSVVLVLKLVSATHVKPTTGIVVSDKGLVLVSADFVSEEGEIVVLDGGTDIPGHGRPAKIIHRSISGGVAVLSVEGLKRPGIILSESALSAESAASLERELHLAAFPPAQDIAKGAQPLWVPVKVSIKALRDESDVQVSVSADPPLPYVTGALLDDCGYLAGLSLSPGAQSLEAGKNPVLMFVDELTRVLDSMLLTLPRASCPDPVQQAEGPVSTQDDSSVALIASEPIEATLESSETEVVTDEVQEPFIQQSPEDTFQSIAADPGKTVTSKTSDPPSIWRSVPLWLPLLGVIILGALIWKVIFFFRSPTTGTSFKGPSASEEPDTAQLLAASGTSGRPRSAPVDEAEIPDMSALPHACNGMVMIAGLLDAETPFKRFCAVNTGQIDIVIGRGNADISIEHPAISRAHARLEGDAEAMTLSDLGSSNGTFISGIPCLPGEIMFIETDDEIHLGDVQLRISVIRKEGELP